MFGVLVPGCSQGFLPPSVCTAADGGRHDLVPATMLPCSFAQLIMNCPSISLCRTQHQVQTSLMGVRKRCAVSTYVATQFRKKMRAYDCATTTFVPVHMATGQQSCQVQAAKAIVCTRIASHAVPAPCMQRQVHTPRA